MSVKINIHTELQQYTNNQETVEVNGTTVGQCIDGLIKQFPKMKKGLFDKNGRLFNYIDIYVNLESSYPEELAKKVEDGDELHITIMAVGG